jgi:hypothetical protein
MLSQMPNNTPATLCSCYMSWYRNAKGLNTAARLNDWWSRTDCEAAKASLPSADLFACRICRLKMDSWWHCECHYILLWMPKRPVVNAIKSCCEYRYALLFHYILLRVLLHSVVSPITSCCEFHYMLLWMPLNPVVSAITPCWVPLHAVECHYTLVSVIAPCWVPLHPAECHYTALWVYKSSYWLF